MIGTEQGNIMTCNRKAKNPQDRVGASFPGKQGPQLVVAAVTDLCQSLIGCLPAFPFAKAT